MFHAQKRQQQLWPNISVCSATVGFALDEKDEKCVEILLGRIMEGHR